MRTLLIKLVAMSTGDVIHSYIGLACPQRGERVKVDGKTYAIGDITHNVASMRDGNGTSYYLEHIEVKIAI